MCDLNTIHYLLLPHKIVSCGCQDRMMRHTLELSEVNCADCIEIEMGKDVDSFEEERRIERGQNNWAEGRRR